MKTNQSPQASSSRPIDAMHDLPSNSWRTRVSGIFQFGAVKKMVDKAKADSEAMCGNFKFSPLVYPILFILTTLFTPIFHFSNIAWANDKEVTRVGNDTYSKSQVIRDFLTAAFSNTLWTEEFKSDDVVKSKLDTFAWLLEDYNSFTPNASPVFFSERFAGQFKRDAPWLWPYYSHVGGFPKHNVINKWSTEISIGIDWPAYNDFAINFQGKGLPPLTVPRGPEDSYSIIEDQIKKLIPDLRKLTGLPVKFIAPSDPIERIKNFARVRIIPVHHTGQRNFFKTWKYIGYSTFLSQWSFTQAEIALFGGVAFTPYARSQVDGYFLPNPDNTIGLAVCKIWPVVGEEMMRALITECLARVVGLPEIVSDRYDLSLGHWNASHDKTSKILALDSVRETYLSTYDMHMQRNELYGALADTKNKKHIDENTDKQRLYFSFQPYDRALMALLYCPRVKPAMDKYQVIGALSGDGECLARMTNIERKSHDLQ